VKKNKSIIRILFSNTALLINIGTVVWLGFCYIASIAQPSQFKFIALFSLTTPFALLANAFFVFFWLFSSKIWRVLISLIPLLLSYNMIAAIFGYHYFTDNDWSRSEKGFKLMSWNTHGMGIYEPAQEKQLSNDIIRLISREHPDILCLPEFSVNVNPLKNKNLRQLINDNDFIEYRINTDHILNKKVVVGTAILSKFPIHDYKVYNLNTQIYLLQCDVQVQADKIIRVYVLHLHSFMLTDKDKEYIEQLKGNTDDLKKSKPFLSRFNTAYIKRSREAEKVATIIRQSPYPTIVCGDYNDLPYSYTYTTIKRNLADAFSKKGQGFGRTYNGISTTLRIDHILFSDSSLHLKAFKTIQTDLSDHNPVLANFELKGK
jgi:endonuclease/exonuclease/phosphatase family metal-dependent hydrolase